MNADIFLKANGRFTMVAFWVAIAIYTKFTYFS